MARAASAVTEQLGARGSPHWRYAVAALTVLVATSAAPCGAQPPHDDRATMLPKHLYVAPSLRPIVDAMLRQSPTFRLQIAHIQRTPRLGIAIIVEPPARSRPADAHIRRFDSGVVLATIRIRSATDRMELVAHELEHVREQIEGAAVPRLFRAGRGAWAAGDAYETDRAIEAGRRVSREMRSSEPATQ